MPSDEFAGVEFEPDGDELARLRDEHDWHEHVERRQRREAAITCAACRHPHAGRLPA